MAMDGRADGGGVLREEGGGCFLNGTNWERTTLLRGDQGEKGVGGGLENKSLERGRESKGTRERGREEGSTPLLLIKPTAVWVMFCDTEPLRALLFPRELGDAIFRRHKWLCHSPPKS